jgi:hypothetical protein
MRHDHGPIVDVLTIGRRAHLIAWHPHQGAWWACLWWLDFPPSNGFGDRHTFDNHYLCVRADHIRPVDGWDYTRVPRGDTDLPHG